MAQLNPAMESANITKIRDINLVKEALIMGLDSS